jgi:uncharacterized protein YjbI with pentapeptide repeats
MGRLRKAVVGAGGLVSQVLSLVKKSRNANAGPSAPLKNASLRMTDFCDASFKNRETDFCDASFKNRETDFCDASFKNRETDFCDANFKNRETDFCDASFKH